MRQGTRYDKRKRARDRERERETEREGKQRKHMPQRLVPRRSKPYLASSCSCFTARGTATAQTALPGAPSLPPPIPLSSRSPFCVSPHCVSQATGHAATLEGPTASLKRAAVSRHLSSPRPSSSRSLPPPCVRLSLSLSLSLSLCLSSPKARYRSLRTRCRSKGG